VLTELVQGPEFNPKHITERRQTFPLKMVGTSPSAQKIHKNAKNDLLITS
jgi:hypothetical protein